MTKAAAQLPDSSASVDSEEVAKFSAIAEEWWEPKGKFRPLHKLNPTRLAFIRDHILRHFDLPANKAQPLEELKLLDIGCGGGLLSEPLTRLGAEVTGIDASQRNISIASVHAKEMGLHIDYRATTAEAMAEEENLFDVVLNMEVIEHVADVDSFLEASSQLLRPGGLMILATLNRTPKSFAFAIVGAEYLLRWLPRGTHDWKRFLRPSELAHGLQRVGMDVKDATGVVYNPVDGGWRLDRRDLDVNFMMVAAKEA